MILLFNYSVFTALFFYNFLQFVIFELKTYSLIELYIHFYLDCLCVKLIVWQRGLGHRFVRLLIFILTLTIYKLLYFAVQNFHFIHYAWLAESFGWKTSRLYCFQTLSVQLALGSHYSLAIFLFRIVMPYLLLKFNLRVNFVYLSGDLWLFFRLVIYCILLSFIFLEWKTRIVFVP